MGRCPPGQPPPEHREPLIRVWRQTPAGTDGLLLTVAWFETGMPKGPALGDPETIAWHEFASIFEWRREGEKDGCCFVPARFKLEADGRQVRRLGVNVLARTAIALDVETNKKTGEVPPALDTAIRRIEALGPRRLWLQQPQPSKRGRSLPAGAAAGSRGRAGSARRRNPRRAVRSVGRDRHV